MPKSKKLSIFKGLGASARINPKGEITLRKIGITAKRLKTDPAYKRTRENMSEFSHAAKTGKLIRYAFAAWLKSISNPHLSGALVKTLMELIKSDATNNRGSRNIMNANLESLERFEFNEKKQYIAGAFPLTFRFQKENKQILVRMKAVRQKDIYLPAPPYATHVKVHPILVAINPGEQYKESFCPPEATPVSILEEYIPQQIVTAAITIPPPYIIMVALFIEFSQCVNGRFGTIWTEGKNSLTIVKVFIANK